MRLFTVTFKDLRQSSRSLTLFVFMFVIPILVTSLFVVMFGSIGDDDQGFELPTTKVVIVNLDQGQMPEGLDLGVELPGFSGADIQQADNMGQILAMLFKSGTFGDLMEISEAGSEADGRAAVDRQEAEVAVIIPADFTVAISGLGQPTSILMYSDPTLTFGPAIVESIVAQLVDGFAANQIAINISLTQLAESGVNVDENLAREVASELSARSAAKSSASMSGETALVEIRSPGGTGESTNLLTEIISLILAGMMVFFAFFTGSASMETILVEDEKGTLARLFTTPNSHRTILAGKGVAGIFSLIVQIMVLMSIGALVFNVDWGSLPTVLLAALGLIIVSAATGIFLVSFLDNTRQGGIVFGGVLTLTGMIGLIPVFTAGNPDQPESIGMISLFVPQGWAIRGFTISMDGGTVRDVLPIFAILMAWSLVFAYIGQRRMQKRFA